MMLTLTFKKLTPKWKTCLKTPLGGAIIGYIIWVGFFIALFLRDKGDTLVRRHLNQALILNIVEVFAGYITRRGHILGTIAEILDIACLILPVMGIARAAKANEEPLPVIGGIELIRE